MNEPTSGKQNLHLNYHPGNMCKRLPHSDQDTNTEMPRSAHMQWRSQKMKVKLAAQTFRASVADALEFCIDGLRLEQFESLRLQLQPGRLEKATKDHLLARRYHLISHDADDSDQRPRPAKTLNIQGSCSWLHCRVCS